MATKNLKTLNRKYETDNFFEVIVESYINGHLNQCREYYKQLKIKDRKDFILYIIDTIPHNAYYILNACL